MNSSAPFAQYGSDFSTDIWTIIPKKYIGIYLRILLCPNNFGVRILFQSYYIIIHNFSNAHLQFFFISESILRIKPVESRKFSESRALIKRFEDDFQVFRYIFPTSPCWLIIIIHLVNYSHAIHTPLGPYMHRSVSVCVFLCAGACVFS